jgi:hypothetical protein
MTSGKCYVNKQPPQIKLQLSSSSLIQPEDLTLWAHMWRIIVSTYQEFQPRFFTVTR